MTAQPASENETVCIVLPTYCEAENIAARLDTLANLELKTNIVLVDDNSPDGTAELAEKYLSDDLAITIIRRQKKDGLGSAYLEGFARAMELGSDLVVTMDSDLSHRAEDLPPMLVASEDADVVIGSRYVDGGEIQNWPKRRRLLSWAANRFVKGLFGLAAHDCTAGYRVYRRSVVEEIIEKQPSSPGYSFQVEALLIASGMGARVKEVPICFVERASGTSKMGWHEIVYGAGHLLARRLRKA